MSDGWPERDWFEKADQDQAAFGRYRTRDLILAYMNALAAGDTETVVAV